MTDIDRDRLHEIARYCAIQGMTTYAEYLKGLAERSELEKACRDMLEDLDSFDGPEKHVDGPFAHFCPAGRMLDMKHAARIRAILLSTDNPK